MNKKIILLTTIWISLMLVMPVSYIGADWFEKKAEPKQDVWQESCNPIVVLKSETSCQQSNYIIKQNAEIIQLLKGINGGFRST